MKRLNVKKLAAIGVGAALMGMALAPMAAALTKSDVLKGDGTPFDVVVGKNAAPSDYLWAGNIAAKLAQLATEDTAVSCTATGWKEGKGPTGEATSTPCEVSDLSVDLAVGGSTVYKSGTAYTYDDSYLNSVSTTPEWNYGMLGNSKLDNLLDDTWTYTYNGSSYTQTVKEFIGINADAKMDTRSDVRDLVAYIGESDFNYMVRLGAGIPYSPSFTKNDNNVIYVPWFGKKYTLLSASSTEVKLIDEAKKKTYDAGQKITGLKGKGDYAGQDLEIEFVSLTSSSASGSYSALFKLYDAEGNLIDDYTATAPGVFLEDHFTQATGGYPLETSVYVDDFAKQDVSDTGYVTVTVGTNAVQLVDGGMYPYDSTVTSSSRKYWKVKFTKGTATVGATSSVPVISEITVYNAGVEGYSLWDHKMPIWSADDSLYDHNAGKAVFLNGEPETSLGYGFATFQFAGWKHSEDTTSVEIGADISGHGGTGKLSGEGIIYTDTGEQKHYIPFYINGLSSSIEQDFYFDGGQNKKYYFRTGTSGVTDLNVCDGNYLNGIAVDINGDGIRVDGGGRGNTAGTTYDINGVAFVVHTAASADNNCIVLDTNRWFQLSTTSFDSGVTTVEGHSAAPWNNKFYVDTKDTLPTSSTQSYATVKLLGDDSEEYEYAFFYDEGGDIWLMLDNKTNFTPRFGYDFALVGTEIDTATETGTPNASFYVPDDSLLGAGSTSGTYRIAKFSFTDKGTGTGYVYINTNDGKLPPIGNTNLSGYTNEFTFTGANGETLDMTYDNESSNIQKGWTDYGTKIWIENQGSWNAVIPQNREYLKMSVLGPSAEVTTTGEKLAGLAEGETGTTSDNVKVTVDKIYATCGTCKCAPGGGVEPSDVELSVTPSVVKKIHKIGTQIVYTDDAYYTSTGFVAVGGQLVNSKAAGAGLENKLTAAGDTVVEQTDNGDWIVAGYTADDTVTAAKQFIDQLDAAFTE